MAYQLIAAGGTFDHLHEGHKAFLLWLFSQSENVLLGLTSDKFAHETKHTKVEPFDERKEHIDRFLQEKDLLDKVRLIAIDDIFGPLLTNEYQIDALGVTEDTMEGGELINTKRQELGLNTFPILIMRLEIDNNGEAISSTNIRLGKINQKGEIWVKEEWRQHTYQLPKNMRDQLHKPFGSILSSVPHDINPETTITVGDVTTKLFNMHKIKQKISIVDFVVERTQLFHSLDELEFVQKYNQIMLPNPAAHITKNAWAIIEKVVHNEAPTVIQVQGEEDLLVLVCILVAPLGYRIFYGQPHEGLVDVQVTPEAKKRAFELMDEFVKTKD